VAFPAKTAPNFDAISKEKKGKEVDLYSAYRQYLDHYKRSDVDHTDYLQIEGETAVNSLFHLANRYTTHSPSHWG